MNERTFSRAQVAEAIGCSPEVIANWIKRGFGLFQPDDVAIVSTGPGKGYRFTVEAAIQVAVAVNLTRFGASPEDALRAGFRFASNPNNERRYGIDEKGKIDFWPLKPGELRPAPMPFPRGATLGVWAPGYEMQVINDDTPGRSMPIRDMPSLLGTRADIVGHVVLHLARIYDDLVTQLITDPDDPFRNYRRATPEAPSNPTSSKDQGDEESP